MLVTRGRCPQASVLPVPGHQREEQVLIVFDEFWHGEQNIRVGHDGVLVLAPLPTGCCTPSRGEDKCRVAFVRSGVSPLHDWHKRISRQSPNETSNRHWPCWDLSWAHLNKKQGASRSTKTLQCSGVSR